MSKKRINDWIAPAVQILANTDIAVNGKVDSGYRTQISSFGAAVVMGSLAASAASFSQRGRAKVDRSKLLTAMYCLVAETEKIENPEMVLRYICNHDTPETRSRFMDAAVALKLAMNFYDLGQEEKKNDESESTVQ